MDTSTNIMVGIFIVLVAIAIYYYKYVRVVVGIPGRLYTDKNGNIWEALSPTEFQLPDGMAKISYENINGILTDTGKNVVKPQGVPTTF